MDNNKSLKTKQEFTSMATEKTNQDFNKQKPNPNNPNQINNLNGEEIKESPEINIENEEIKEKITQESNTEVTDPKPSAMDHVNQLFKEDHNKKTISKSTIDYQHINENREEKADAMRIKKSNINN